MNAPAPTIPEQITLPSSVALEVVLQGFRIRFGRSIVTILGVVFGIAFLMSIFTGLVLKSGVATEEKLRIDTDHMYSFLTAESGLPTGHSFGLIADGPLTKPEERLLQKMDDLGMVELRVAAPAATLLPDFHHAKVTRVTPETIGTGASGVLWTGEKIPASGWTAAFSGARQDVLLLTRAVPVAAPPAPIQLTLLTSTPTEDRKAREAADARKTRMRNSWIIIISLLVTIIGISNAMLMSVTERFREIGTMKCLGALSSFVRRMFLIESGLMGLVGGFIGCLIGLGFSMIAYALTYGAGLAALSLWQGLGTLLTYSVVSIAAGLVLSILAALYPAGVASNMVPATALRSNI